MSQGQDASPAAVAFMRGLAIGIPAMIVAGILTHQTWWGIGLGPVAGVVLGLVLAAGAKKGSTAA